MRDAESKPKASGLGPRAGSHQDLPSCFFTLDNLFPSDYIHQRGPGLNAGRLIFLRRSQCYRDWGPCSWEVGLRGFASRHALLSPLTSNCLLTRL